MIVRWMASQVRANMAADFKNLKVPPTIQNQLDYLDVLKDCLRRHPQGWLVRKTNAAIDHLKAELRNT